MHNDPSRSSKVTDFGTNRKRVYDFLFDFNSNLAPILPRFRDIRTFVRRKQLFQLPTPIRSKISGCSLWSRLVVLLLQRANVPGYLMVKLFLKNSNLCDHNSPTSQTDGRTEGRTDRQTTCDRNTALCTKVHRAVKTLSRN